MLLARLAGPATAKKAQATSKPKAKAARKKTERDVEKSYPMSQFVAKLRRFADSLEKNKQFAISIAGERVTVPVRAQVNIEHERENGAEEIEFQIKWRH